MAALVVANALPHEPFAEGMTQEAGAATPLNLNETVEGRLKGGELRRYRAAVGEGQYLHINVEQRGVDVLLLFSAPDGRELLRIDTPNGVNGLESLDFIAAQAGEYQLVVTTLDKNAQAGDYRVRLTELRKSQPADGAKIVRQQALMAATERENRANELIAKGQFAEAEPLTQEAATLRRGVEGQAYLSNSLSLLALSYEGQGKNEQALHTLEEALPYLEKDEGAKSANVGFMLFRIGRFYLSQNNLSRAETNLVRAAKILDGAKGLQPDNLMIAHQTLAILYKTQKLFPKAEAQYLRAIKLAGNTQGGPEGANSAFLTDELGELYLEQKDITRAAGAFEKAWAMCDKNKFEPQLTIKVLLNLATAKNVEALLARNQNDFVRAEAKGREVLEILKRLPDDVRKNEEAEYLKARSLFLNNLAETLLARGDEKLKDSEVAEGYLNEALATCEKYIPEHDLTASVLMNMGRLFYKRRKYARAESFLTRAVDLRRSLKSPGPTLFGPLYLLGQLEQDEDNLTRAEPLLLEARRLAEQSPAMVAEIDDHLGSLYTSTVDFAHAEFYLQHALTFYEKDAHNEQGVANMCISMGKMYAANGDFNRAEAFMSRAVAIHRRMVKTRGKLTAPQVALLGPLMDLIHLYIDNGNYERAEPLIREVREIIVLPGADDYSLGMHMALFAGFYSFRGQFAQEETLLREAQAHVKPGTVLAAHVLDMLGIHYTATADYAKAEDCLKQAIAIREALDKDDPDLTHSFRFLAELYRQQGRFALAEAQADRSLALIERVYGPDHVKVTEQLQFAGLVYMTAHDYGRAETLLRRRLAIVEKEFGPEHPEVAEALESICLLYGVKNDFLSFMPLRERAVAILEKWRQTKPLNSEQTLTLANLHMISFDEKELRESARLLTESLYKDEHGGILVLGAGKRFLLGEVYGLMGELTLAEQAYKEALTAAERVGNVGSLDTIQPLKLVADFYASKLDYAEAEKYYGDALKAQREHFGPTHPSVADLLTGLGDLDRARGDYVKPEADYLEALEIRKAAFGADSNPVLESQIKLADLYRDRGEYARAEQLYREILKTAEPLDGPNSLPVFNAYFGLGGLYRNKEEYDKAAEAFQKAQTIVEVVYGRLSLFSWGTLVIPARMYLQEGDPAKAQPLLKQVLTTHPKSIAVDDISESFLRLSLGETYNLQGDYVRAASLISEALATREKVLGSEHPTTILALEALADTRQMQGDLPEAVRLRTLAAEGAEKNIKNFLASGSERQKSQFLVTFNKSTDAIVSLHLRAAPDDVNAKRLALTTILHRKGRALDVFSDQIASLRNRAAPEDKVLLEKLAAASARWANLVFRSAALAEAPPQPGKLPNLERETRDIETEIQQLEATLSARSAEFRAQTQTVTIDAVRAALPPETALVEFIAYRPYDPAAKGYKNRFGPTRYAAYVLTREGEEPGFVDLGEAQPIDTEALGLRSLLGERADERRVKRAGNALYQKIFAPLVHLLGGRKRVMLVPDGNLNLVQFAALADGDGRYLLETYDLSYLTSGRELVRLQEPFASNSAATVIANPAFDLTQPEATCPPNAYIDNQFDFKQRCYSSLPGTAREAVELNQLLPDAQVWTGADATEANLKSVQRPYLLHLATHGYFFPDPVPANSSEAMPPVPTDAAKRGAHQLNPMARSGLILAGVKQGSSGSGEDGVLTAQEVAGLNLLGTKLVVLSACKTALGDAQNGQGIYGLRRALVLAGSETQVMSLWKVSDNATLALMVAYYKRLQTGEGRAEALRQVQLAMLCGELLPAPAPHSGTRETSDTLEDTPSDYRHPYYWAAFIQSGDWRSMDGTEKR